MKYIIGVDVGATKIAAGLLYGDHIPKSIKIPTEADMGKRRIILNIIKAIRVFDNPKIHAIGLAVAGEIDSHKGMVVQSPNMPKEFTNIPLVRILKREFKKDVYIENDGNCFALAESVFGAGKKCDYVVGLTLGTGIGSGLVIRKHIYSGATGRATEFGHTTIAENGYVCGCGKRGHLEAYASGTAMMRIYEELTGETKDTFYIEEMAKRKQREAIKTFAIMSDALSIGIANIINALNPDIIVLGGGLTRVKPLWRRAVRNVSREIVYDSLKKTKVVASKLKDMATIYGAALITEKTL